MGEEYDLESGPDPATFAAATPEPDIDSEEDPVYAVGVGPGNLEYLTPRGERALAEADVVVGFSTVVEFIEACTDADLLTCGYKDERDALETFAERVTDGEAGTAVAMGDPNHSGYQFVGKVQDVIEQAATERGLEARPLRIIPGISSIQMAASRARTPIEDTEFVTLHKSGDLEDDIDRLTTAVVDDERHLLVLPRPYDLMPGDIAAHLLDHGAHPDLEALVLEKLTHDDETVHRFRLAELSAHAGGSGPEGTPFSDLIVLCVRQPVEQ